MEHRGLCGAERPEEEKVATKPAKHKCRSQCEGQTSVVIKNKALDLGQLWFEFGLLPVLAV